jgi:hypothetical protein
VECHYDTLQRQGEETDLEIDLIGSAVDDSVGSQVFHFETIVLCELVVSVRSAGTVGGWRGREMLSAVVEVAVSLCIRHENGRRRWCKQ